MIAALSTAMLVCAVSLPLKEGQAAKDREIATIRSKLPEAMLQSLRGPVPLSTQRFAGEAFDRHEWIVANPPAQDGSTKMIRLTPQVNVYYQFKARLGDAKLSPEGVWSFAPIGEGSCRVEAGSLDKPELAQ